MSAMLAKAGRCSRVSRGTGRSLGGGRDSSQPHQLTRQLCSHSPQKLLEQRGYIGGLLALEGEASAVEGGLQLLLHEVQPGSRARDAQDALLTQGPLLQGGDHLEGRGGEGRGGEGRGGMIAYTHYTDWFWLKMTK